jgi:hypothetical protein
MRDRGAATLCTGARVILMTPVVALVGHPTGPHTLVLREGGKIVKRPVWLLAMVVPWPLPDPEDG